MKIEYDHDEDYVRMSKIAREMQREFDAFYICEVKVGEPMNTRPIKNGLKLPCGCCLDEEKFKMCDKHTQMRKEGNRDETSPTMMGFLTEGVDTKGHRVIIAVDTHPGPAIYHFQCAVNSAMQKFGSFSKLTSIRVRPILLNHFYGMDFHEVVCNSLRGADGFPLKEKLDRAPFLSNSEIDGIHEEEQEAEKKAAKKRSKK